METFLQSNKATFSFDVISFVFKCFQSIFFLNFFCLTPENWRSKTHSHLFTFPTPFKVPEVSVDLEVYLWHDNVVKIAEEAGLLGEDVV